VVQQFEISLPEYKRGFHLITRNVEQHLPVLPSKGLVNIFIKHTSAALALNENADPSVRKDFEAIFNKLVPENQSYYTHTLEGSDDMPAHIKSSVIGQAVTVPITNGRLNLGTWQGIYLCEFRNYGGSRNLVITVIGE
jgi:secondary thiamine-phosphate synthase enzyme